MAGSGVASVPRTLSSHRRPSGRCADKARGVGGGCWHWGDRRHDRRRDWREDVTASSGAHVGRPGGSAPAVARAHVGSSGRGWYGRAHRVPAARDASGLRAATCEQTERRLLDGTDARETGGAGGGGAGGWAPLPRCAPACAAAGKTCVPVWKSSRPRCRICSVVVALCYFVSVDAHPPTCTDNGRACLHPSHRSVVGRRRHRCRHCHPLSPPSRTIVVLLPLCRGHCGGKLSGGHAETQGNCSKFTF